MDYLNRRQIFTKRFFNFSSGTFPGTAQLGIQQW